MQVLENYSGGWGNPRMEWILLKINVTINMCETTSPKGVEVNGADLSHFGDEGSL